MQFGRMKPRNASTSADMCRPLGECPPMRDGPRRAKQRYTFAEAIAAVDNPNPRRHRRIPASSDYSNSAHDTASLAPSYVSPIKRSAVLQRAAVQQRSQKFEPLLRRERNSSFESNVSSITGAIYSHASLASSSMNTKTSKRTSGSSSRLVQGYTGPSVTDRTRSKNEVFHRSLSMFGGAEARAPFVPTTAESRTYKSHDKRFTTDWPHEPVQVAVLSREDRKFATPHAMTMNDPMFPFAKNPHQDNPYPLPDTRKKTDWPHEPVQAAVLPREDRKFATAYAMTLNDTRFPFAKEVTREPPKKTFGTRDIYDMSCLDMPVSEEFQELAENDPSVHRAIFEVRPTEAERECYAKTMQERLGRSEWIFDDLPDPWDPDFDAGAYRVQAHLATHAAQHGHNQHHHHHPSEV
jgi:hypothetical protein